MYGCNRGCICQNHCGNLGGVGMWHCCVAHRCNAEGIPRSYNAICCLKHSLFVSAVVYISCEINCLKRMVYALTLNTFNTCLFAGLRS